MGADTLSVKNMSTYTKTGDDGTTSLFGGKRILKTDKQVEAYGSVDELSSFLGLVIFKLNKTGQKAFLTRIQKDLSKIMAHLAGYKTSISHLEKSIEQIEQKIDLIEKELPKLNSFILPGGGELCCLFHILRAICRRAERRIIVPKNRLVLKYLNRLSDLFFVLARHYNAQKEILV